MLDLLILSFSPYKVRQSRWVAFAMIALVLAVLVFRCCFVICAVCAFLGDALISYVWLVLAGVMSVWMIPLEARVHWWCGVNLANNLLSLLVVSEGATYILVLAGGCLSWVVTVLMLRTAALRVRWCV